MFSTIASGITSRLAWQKRSHSSATLDSLNDSIAMIEFMADGTIITANALFLEKMGYKSDEIVGQHHSMFCTPDLLQSRQYQQFWPKFSSFGASAAETLAAKTVAIAAVRMIFFIAEFRIPK